MNQKELLDLFGRLNVWKRNGERAPHKPLLSLLALAALSRGETRLFSFNTIDKPLQNLLREFGPPRKSFHSEYPFWRLKNDGVWEVANATTLECRRGNSDPKKSELIKHNVLGGFTPGVFNLLSLNRSLLRNVVQQLLDFNFPESYHEDILAAVGLGAEYECTTRRTRDPRFRETVLMAYEYECAVCGLALRLGGRELGLEAAHIKWHQAGGPDTANNGLALCSIHHKLLDRGAIGITPDLRIQVSQFTSGNSGFSNWVMKFNGVFLRSPQHTDYVLNQDFIDWHMNEVFRTPARPIDFV
jgi:putative restriction endonuclease